MAHKNLLTASQIHYLLVMKRLNQDGRGIRGAELARELKISRPSVHSMLSILEDMDFVKKDSRGIAFFTEYGFKISSVYEKCFHILNKKIFSSNLHNETTELAICAFMAELSEQNLSECLGM